MILSPPIRQSQAVIRPQKPFGGTFKWGVYHKPTIINPILTTQSISMALLDLIFNRLVRINSEGEIEPDLAESWDISTDGLIYTFHLRKGVRFHDGKECTAQDVKFTYDKIIDPGVNSPFKEGFQLVREFRVIDKYTLEIILKEPSTSFLYRLVREIAPQHLLEKEDLRNTPFNFHPIGTGPFKFKEWTKDDQIILEYNADYYEGRPYLDKILVKTYDNSEDAWSALMQGEVDCVQFIEEKDYEVVKNDPAFKAYAVPTDYYYALVYNLNDPILTDKRVREAIAYSVDRKGLIDKIAGGYGIECSGPFYPDSLGFNPEVKAFEYNPKKAQRLLSEAGWQDMDNDGILEKENKELELKVLVDARNEIYAKIIMLLRQQLQEVGIKIKVQLYNDDSDLTKDFIENNGSQAHLKFMRASNPDAILEDWSVKESQRVGKLWIYSNKKVDKLLALGEVAQDRAKREVIYKNIHQLIYKDQPGCFLYFPFVFHAVSARFKNTDAYFNINMPTYAIKDFFIENMQTSAQKEGR